MTTRSKYFPPQTTEPALTTSNNEHVRTLAREKVADTKPAGSSLALRIACPACSAPAGSPCTKFRVDQGPDGSRRPARTTVHKRRREEEERTR